MTASPYCDTCGKNGTDSNPLDTYGPATLCSSCKHKLDAAVEELTSWDTYQD